MKKINFIIAFAAIISLSAISTSAHAVTAAEFKAGRIIDDSVFTNKDSMSAVEIQSFLERKVPTCDTNGEQLSEFGGTDINGDGKVQRWEWAKGRFNETTFTCLKDYKENNVTAAEIIHNVAQENNINPQVLIVLLQKENGLVTDTWPLSYQYNNATGIGCFDTFCAVTPNGLTNQLDWSAKFFNVNITNDSNWALAYSVGVNYIQYSPITSCGGGQVTIENRATQALYNYTPYQPNQAALNAGYGVGDNCSSYGNRNFWLYFNDWFGSTLVVTTPAPTAALTVNGKESDSVAYGSTITLHWASQHADTCSINDENKTTTTGDQTVSNIRTNTAYNLQCAGKGGNTADSAQVTVLAPTFDYLLVQINTIKSSAQKPSVVNGLVQDVRQVQRSYARGDIKKATKALQNVSSDIDKLVKQKKLPASDGNNLKTIIRDLIASKS